VTVAAPAGEVLSEGAKDGRYSVTHRRACGLPPEGPYTPCFECPIRRSIANVSAPGAWYASGPEPARQYKTDGKSSRSHLSKL
jgi:hypothetical protein